MSSANALSGSPVVRRLLAWFRDWRKVDYADDPFLANACDLADLERRLKSIEREPGGPLTVTFNH